MQFDLGLDLDQIAFLTAVIPNALQKPLTAFVVLDRPNTRRINPTARQTQYSVLAHRVISNRRKRHQSRLAQHLFRCAVDPRHLDRHPLTNRVLDPALFQQLRACFVRPVWLVPREDRRLLRRGRRKIVLHKQRLFRVELPTSTRFHWLITTANPNHRPADFQPATVLRATRRPRRTTAANVWGAVRRRGNGCGSASLTRRKVASLPIDIASIVHATDDTAPIRSACRNPFRERLSESTAIKLCPDWPNPTNFHEVNNDRLQADRSNLGFPGASESIFGPWRLPPGELQTLIGFPKATSCTLCHLFCTLRQGCSVPIFPCQTQCGISDPLGGSPPLFPPPKPPSLRDPPSPPEVFFLTFSWERAHRPRCRVGNRAEARYERDQHRPALILVSRLCQVSPAPRS